MKTICIHSYKGGTGKTTFLLNIAGSIAKSGKKALAVDYDLRAPSFQSYFKVKQPFYLSNYLLEEKSITDIIYPCKSDNGVQLDLVFSSMEFLKQHSSQRDKLSRDDAKYLSKLYQLQSKVSDSYDFLLFDTIPGFFYRSIDAMMISDIIIVIATPSTSNILGLMELTNNIYSMLRKEAKMFLIINKIEEEGIDADKDIFDNNLKQLKKLGAEQFDSVIEIPYFNILSERIYAFEEEVNEEFMLVIDKINDLLK